MKRLSRWPGLAVAVVAGLALASSNQPTEQQTPPSRVRPSAPPPRPASPAPAPATPVTPSGQPGSAPSQAINPAAAKELVEPGPYVTRERPTEWTFRARIEVHGRTWVDSVATPGGRPVNMPRHENFEFDQLTVVFPVLPQTASSVPEEKSTTGVLRVADREVTREIRMLEGYPAGVRLASMTALNGKARQVDFEIETRMTSFRTILDEEAASKVQWPKGPWPGAAASTFQRQIYLDFGPDPENPGKFVDYDPKPLADAVARWTGGNDPKSIAPLVLAKFLAGKVMEEVQISGDGLTYTRTSQLEGVKLQSIEETLRLRRGSEFDMVNLLCATYRYVGLPARTVIAYARTSRSQDVFRDRSRQKLRAWVEFGLYDENYSAREATFNWVPVDVVQLRKMTSRAPDLNREWRYFGTVNDLDDATPFAFQFHPPTTVRSYGSPGFWGWMMSPKDAAVDYQSLLFQSNVTPRRGGDRRDR